MIFILTGSILLNLNTLSGSKITIVVQSGGKDLESAYTFGSIFAEKDTRLGSKNGENDTLPSGTYLVPKILKPPPGIWKRTKQRRAVQNSNECYSRIRMTRLDAMISSGRTSKIFLLQKFGEDSALGWRQGTARRLQPPVGGNVRSCRRKFLAK